MKKIINNKQYNTDTARSLGTMYDGDGIDGISETLYQKRTGEYFIHGEGGARTKYAHQTDGGGWAGGEMIIPMSYEQARGWAEEHMSADDFQAAFGEVSEGEDVMISAKLTAATDAKLRRMAAESGISITAMITRLIEQA